MTDKTVTIAAGMLLTLCAATSLAQPPQGSGPRGKEVYDYWCLPCHGPGLGLPGFNELPGTQQLRIKYRDTQVSPLLEERTDLVPVFIKTIVRQGVSFMPQFRKTEISDADLDALAAYLARNSPAGPQPPR
ncbi:MAG TPA: cytochrome c [Gammaproteobacteria bacterium]|nr:cytochrome c [Gammaproteobacteria bacterium]